MKQSEAKRTIVMLATQLAKARLRARISRLDLKLMVETVNELDAAMREMGSELRAYREEEARRGTTHAVATEETTGAMSFGQAIELMARRPGLELVDNEKDKWRVTGGGKLQILMDRDTARNDWEDIDIDNSWNLLTFRIPS